MENQRFAQTKPADDLMQMYKHLASLTEKQLHSWQKKLITARSGEQEIIADLFRPSLVC